MVHTGLVLLALATVATAFYLPGTKPEDYQPHARIEMTVGKMDSVKTQVPFEYYTLPFCAPTVVEEASENLGEIMSGDVVQSSDYEVFMKVIESCKILCKKDYTADQLAKFEEAIGNQYEVNWMLDNLPAATKYYTESTTVADSGAASSAAGAHAGYTAHYEKGFALGFVGSELIPRTTPGQKYINNHVRLTVHINEDPEAHEGYRVVGFEVEPFSVHHTWDQWQGKTTQLNTCNPLNKVTHSLPPQSVSDAAVNTIVFTYDVQFEKSEIKWASRWDMYLKMTDSQIHWFSIINSIMIALFLSAMVAMIMIRTLHKDLSRYAALDAEEAEAQQEETGWKLVHADVFRPPVHGGSLTVLVGTGCQVFAMTLITMLVAVLGFLSPANRGGLMTALVLLFVFMGAFAGYSSARLYKTLALDDWRTNTLWTALFFPGVNFGVFFIVNLGLWAHKSSAAVPFGTLLALLVLWFGISVPLVYLGSHFGNRGELKLPVKVHIIPRLIPEQPWYLSRTLAVLVGGILPFGAVFIEIFFIMSAVWLHKIYYLFGFLAIVFVILIVTCAEISIVMTYFQLCSEDYNWWWRSFLTSGSSALYLFLYSIVYFQTKLEMVKFVSGLLFFGYMFLVSIAFFVLTGTIGFIASFIFVYHIYASVKVD